MQELDINIYNCANNTNQRLSLRLMELKKF